MRCSVSTLARRLELRREVEDVAHLGGAEGVDRLRVVADHRQAAAVGLERVQDARLQPVGVLVLVDQHVLEARAQLARQRGVVEHVAPVQQQVVVVEHALALLLGRVGAEQASSARPPSRRTRGSAAAAPAPAAVLAVEHARIDRQAGALQRKALAASSTGPSSWRTRPIRSSLSPRSAMVKSGFRPMRAACSRSSRAATPWKVPAQGSSGARLRGAQAQRLVQQAADAALQRRPRRGARSSAAGCAAGRRRPAPAGPRAPPASASCPSRRRR